MICKKIRSNAERATYEKSVLLDRLLTDYLREIKVIIIKGHPRGLLYY